MKHQVKVWTISWDTRSGTDCAVFGSEEEWMLYLKGIIESDLADVETEEINEVRSLIAAGEIEMAFELWEESFKPYLDTYNMDTVVIHIDIPMKSMVKSPAF